MQDSQILSRIDIRIKIHSQHLSKFIRKRKRIILISFALITLLIAPFLIFHQLYSQNQPQTLQLPQPRKITAIFLTCCQRHDMLPLTLSSFFKYNQFPIEKTIVVSDGGINSELAQVLDKYDNISLITTGKKVGQLRSLDEALLLVQTPYIYLSEDDWQLYQTGLISQSIDSLQKEPLLLQLWNKSHGKRLLKDRVVDPTQKWGGLSLNPCVMRMSDIAKLQGGKFWKATNDNSYGLGAGISQFDLLTIYKNMGYYVKRAHIQYIRHLGVDRQNPRYLKK